MVEASRRAPWSERPTRVYGLTHSDLMWRRLVYGSLMSLTSGPSRARKGTAITMSSPASWLIVDRLEDGSPIYRLPHFHWGIRRPFSVMCSPAGGFCLIVKLPRMLPGFVKPYQDQTLHTREGRRGTHLHLFIPLLPLGFPHASRTRRGRRKVKR